LGRTSPAGSGPPERIAFNAVVWLAGPGARFTTGQTLHVNGVGYLSV
jgi:hypothetical protein